MTLAAAANLSIRTGDKREHVPVQAASPLKPSPKSLTSSPHRIPRKEVESSQRRPQLSSATSLSYHEQQLSTHGSISMPLSRSLSTPPALEDSRDANAQTESTTVTVVREARQRILARGLTGDKVRLSLGPDAISVTEVRSPSQEASRQPDSTPVGPARPRSPRSAPKLLKRFSLVSTPPPTQSSDQARPASSQQAQRSIDSDVVAYLSSPRFSQKLRRPIGGKTISFSEVGDPDGSVVFCFIGMGLNRYITTFYDDLARSLHLRLITPERPGVGDSDRDCDIEDTPLRWPDDVRTICEALEVTKFSMIAHSAGAIYALAVALHMPQHIRCRIHLLAPWIPPSQLSNDIASSPANLPYSQRFLRSLPSVFLQAANLNFLRINSGQSHPTLPQTKTAAQTAMPSLGRFSIIPETLTGIQAHPPRTSTAPSEQSSAKAENMLYESSLAAASWQMATQGANPYRDLLMCLERSKPIGFKYIDVTRPVIIHHGARDTRVPVENVKWLAERMRRCEVRILNDEGHGLMANAQVMGGVLTEIASEWDDWNRVVAGDTR